MAKNEQDLVQVAQQIAAEAYRQTGRWPTSVEVTVTREQTVVTRRTTTTNRAERR